MSELFGEVQDEKESDDKKKNYVEIKKNKAVETFNLISKTINFKDSFLIIISFI